MWLITPKNKKISGDSFFFSFSQKDPNPEPRCDNNVDANPIAYALVVAENIDSDEPQTYKEAIQSNFASEWLTAMNEEMQSLEKMKHGILCHYRKV